MRLFRYSTYSNHIRHFMFIFSPQASRVLRVRMRSQFIIALASVGRNVRGGPGLLGVRASQRTSDQPQRTQLPLLCTFPNSVTATSHSMHNTVGSLLLIVVVAHQCSSPSIDETLLVSIQSLCMSSASPGMDSKADFIPSSL